MGSPEPANNLSELARPPRLAAAGTRERARGRALRLRFILVVVAVCGAVWLSALFDAMRDRRLTLAEAERQNDNVAGALAEQAARALQATDLILKQAALLDPDVPGAPADRAALPDLLRRHMSGVPQVRNLFLFDPARELHVSTAGANGTSPDLSDRTYYIAQRDNPDQGLFVSEPFISRVTGDPTFVLSRRLPGQSFRGVAGASVDVAYIRHFYQALDLGAGSTIELLRDDGRALVSREHTALGTAPSPWRGALAWLGDRREGHALVDFPGLGRTLVSLRRVAGYPAIVAVGRSETGVLAGWRAKTWSNVLRTFVITSLAALLLVAFLRQLGRHERITTQLYQSQKLEALGTLAGGIAHDFNNILGAVLGYGELALEQSAPGTPLRRYVENIVLAANRARELVARILAFSRPGIASARALVLQDILGDVRNLSSASLPAAVHVDMQMPAAPVVISGDSAQLHQMFANLLTNAVQAMGGAGTVRVLLRELDVGSARDCTVGRLRPARYARVQIIDAGIGMTPAQVERIFDPFFTTKPVGEGTGLGLSLVHGIVLDHAAALEVESRSGQGTTFSVYLPVTDGEPAPAPAATRPPAGAGQTILVVDDEESLVHLAEEVLASLGYEPVGCVGAEEALKVFRAEPARFDAVLSDVIMPEMPGTALVAELRRIRPGLPAILMSGYGGPDLQSQAAAAGVHALLSKPLRTAELAQHLASLFANGAPAEAGRSAAPAPSATPQA
ncbi:MAG: response regulator [Proteobacteria bacterium]|nr:response regulator [Pseudomonadota bacterium]